MINLDLFTWWAISISGGIAFLILVSVYLYANSRTKRKDSSRITESRLKMGNHFVFVWVLIGLLIFYIVSVNIRSSIIFAAGNIVVESILIAYLIRSRHERKEEEPKKGKGKPL